jgi:HK97 family phage major capsid protein
MNIAALERDYEKALAKAKSLFQTQSEQAQQEDRVRTDEEKAEVDGALAEAKKIKARIAAQSDDKAMADEIERLLGGATSAAAPADPSVEPKPEMRSLGQQWVESVAGQFFQQGRHRESSKWQSPSVELNAATLTTTGGSPGSGGDLIIPQYLPGIQPLLFKRLVVADLLASGRTTSNSIVYMKETTFTNAADVVAEGADKPESTLIFDQATDPVRKIAHWIPVTEEMLEDVPAIRSYIDMRMRLGVELEEEDQLLNGSGSGENIRGLMNRTGLATTVVTGGSPGDSNADAIFKQMFSGIFHTAFVQPDGIIMNPGNWQSIALSKNADDQYYAGGPFNTPPVPRLWGLPVVLTPSIALNTALVGAFRTQAQVFRKGGIRVEASNSHSDFFVKNKVAIRAEERLALAVYRPAAFGKVTLT